VYLRIHDGGGTADALESVTTPDAASAQLHAEVRQGAAESMQALADLPVPAHGQAVLSVDGDHLMLTDPRPLRAGDRITLVLHFAVAAPLTVTVPVIGLLDPAPQP
ncbi:MAG TPA: copper chaperone PCu(A)C, partial [Jatrophihabitans sp.]|nr:copper chaperone PCu(A)C [Jatrophihabitans sp.]